MRILLSLIFFAPFFSFAARMDRLTIVAAKDMVAARVLQEEVQRRTGLLWPISEKLPTEGDAIIFERIKSGPESYQVRRQTASYRTRIYVKAAGIRGWLYGAGYLLRSMQYAPGRADLPDTIDIETSPEKAIRGHQLGYRNLANSYDGWTPEQYEQYIRELAIFGTNSI